MSENFTIEAQTHEAVTASLPAPARDTLDLGILGAVREEPRAASEIIAAVQSLAGHEWQPEAGVVSRRIVELAAEGALERQNRTRRMTMLWLALTPKGHARLEALALDPAPGGCLGLVRAQMGARASLAERFEGGVRTVLLERLIAAHEAELHALRCAMARCPCALDYARRRMWYELERLEGELRRFQHLRRNGTAEGADHAAAPAPAARARVH